jgi:hypothetical protein
MRRRCCVWNKPCLSFARASLRLPPLSVLPLCCCLCFTLEPMPGDHRSLTRNDAVVQSRFAFHGISDRGQRRLLGPDAVRVELVSFGLGGRCGQSEARRPCTHGVAPKARRRVLLAIRPTLNCTKTRVVGLVKQTTLKQHAYGYRLFGTRGCVCAQRERSSQGTGAHRKGKLLGARSFTSRR